MNWSIRFEKVLHPKFGLILCKMSRIGQYLGHLKEYEGQILYTDTLHTKLPTVIFVALENRLTWQQMSISISQLFEGVEGLDLV